MMRYIALATIITSLQFAYFVFNTPHSGLLRTNRADLLFARGLYIVAYILALVRLPFAALPYTLKLLTFLVSQRHYRVSQNQYGIEALRIMGDIANLALGLIFIQNIKVVSPRAFNLLLIVGAAEAIRLYAEKGQMVFSAVWQSLPHRELARRLTPRLPAFPGILRSRLGCYCDYYRLDDEQRAAYILHLLHQSEREAGQKLAYVSGFQIVPGTMGLRGGKVRDIARGEIFIHQRWTSDPWLLIGQALRRSPWLFDPRNLPRPFYYRSQSNQMATLFVFQHARSCPSYAFYQFGHEIKAARYDLFYRACRWLGHDIEPLVQADGTFQFDQLIGWLQHKPRLSCPLFSDEQVIAEVQSRRENNEKLSALDIAEQYAYPLKYIEEVLSQKLSVQRKISDVDLDTF